MSDTPRTDAFLENALSAIHETETIEDFTRQLERELAAERERADRLMRLAYLAGWNASGEGYNAEYPFGDSDMDPEADAKWIAVRDTALDAARRKANAAILKEAGE
jgi:hypothetical protein